MMRGSRALVALVAFALLAGCQQPYAAVMMEPLRATDLAASDVDVAIGMQTRADNTTLIAWTFTYQGQVVRFTDLALTCNGVTLRWNGVIVNAYSNIARAPQLTKTFYCDYQRHGIRTVVSLPAPQPPVVLNALSGQYVRRTADIRLDYAHLHQGLTAPGTTYIQCGVDNGAGTNATQSGQLADTGSCDIQPSRLHAGAGAFYVIRTAERVFGDTLFRSCHMQSSAEAVAAVQWV